VFNLNRTPHYTQVHIYPLKQLYRTQLLSRRLVFIVTLAGAERVATLGNRIVASASGLEVARTTVLMSDVILNEGVVFAYSAFFRSDKPVRFQIWRPVENVSDSYQLIGETRVIPAVMNAREDVSKPRLAEHTIA